MWLWAGEIKVACAKYYGPWEVANSFYTILQAFLRSCMMRLTWLVTHESRKFDSPFDFDTQNTND